MWTAEQTFLLSLSYTLRIRGCARVREGAGAPLHACLLFCDRTDSTKESLHYSALTTHARCTVDLQLMQKKYNRMTLWLLGLQPSVSINKALEFAFLVGRLWCRRSWCMSTSAQTLALNI